MSEERREFSVSARRSLGLDAVLIGDVIKVLQPRLPSLFKIVFPFY